MFIMSTNYARGFSKNPLVIVIQHLIHVLHPNVFSESEIARQSVHRKTSKQSICIRRENDINICVQNVQCNQI